MSVILTSLPYANYLASLANSIHRCLFMIANYSQNGPSNIGPWLRCTETGSCLHWDGDAYVSPRRTTGGIRFPVKEGIISAFLPHRKMQGDITTIMQAF